MRKTFLAMFLVLTACKETPAPTDTATTTATDTVTTTAAVPGAPERIVDHYQFWTVQPTPLSPPIPVNVKDQFDRRDLRLANIEWIANPAQKNDEPVKNERIHLVGYNLETDPQFNVNVWVSNQFIREKEEWVLGSPHLVLVPAWKSLTDQLPPEKPEGPHFLCYEVAKAPDVTRTVTIKDQFWEQKVENLHPKYLCTPADKNGEGMWNETDHLALYGFENGHEFNPPKTVYAKDQFGNHQLRVMRSMLLGVPSKKTLPVK